MPTQRNSAPIKEVLLCAWCLCFVACSTKQNDADGVEDTGSIADARQDAFVRWHKDIPEEESEVVDHLSWVGKDCQSHQECASGDKYGYCTATNLEAKRRCVVLCEHGCPAGAECVQVRDPASDTGPISVCLAPFVVSCRQCNDDVDCLRADAWCLEVGKNAAVPDRRCVQDCSNTGGMCANSADYACQPVTHPDTQTPLHLCIPTSGSCICIGMNDAGEPVNGSSRPCESSTDAGTCSGQEHCNGELGWSACDALVPAKETCDAIDNDCDGSTDENLGGYECEDKGCAGMIVCKGEQGLFCDAPAPNEDGLCPDPGS